MALKWKGKQAITYVEQHGGWLRVDGKGMVSLADAKKADPEKVTGGPRAKAAAKPKAEKKPKDKKPAKPKAAKKPKAKKPRKGKAPAGAKGVVAKIAKIKRLVNSL